MTTLDNEPEKDINQQIQELSGWKKFLFVGGGICFVITATFVFIHLGFVMDDASPVNVDRKPFLSRQELWLTNLCIGALGGAMIGHKRLLIGALSGLFAAAAITGASLFYLSWRETFYTAELFLPLMTGFVGFGIYNLLDKNKG